MKVQADTTTADTLVGVVSRCAYDNLAEREAHVQTATMKASANNFIARARYILYFPTGSAGKFEAVAAVASDDNSTHSLVRSRAVTFNGGVAAPFPPAIVATSVTLPAERVSVEALGVGLGTTASATIVAPDTSWALPLSIAQATDTTFSASADLPMDLPAGVLQISTGAAMSTATEVATAGCHGKFRGIGFNKQFASGATEAVYVDPNPGISTKDFAFFLNHYSPTDTHLALFHLMYIRHADAWARRPPQRARWPTRGHTIW